jgi:signal transduction histidine kinase
MHHPPHLPSRRPSWWPENEPWPPTHAPGWRDGRGMRGRFLARIGCGFFLLLAFTLAGFSAAYFLFSHVLGRIRFEPRGIQEARWGVIALIAAALVVVLVIGYNLRKAALPFGSLLEAAGRVANGDFSARVPAQGPREIRELASAFNGMAQRLQASAEERRGLLADVTHELRTPLTVIQGNLEGMLDGVYPADPAHLEPLLEETRTLARVIADLRTLSLAESGALPLLREPLDPGELLRDVAAAYQARAQAAGVEIQVEAGADLPGADLDPIRMREILANLLVNALRYTPSGGSVHLSCRAAGGRLNFTVQDSGPGISPQDLSHVFERYYKGAGSPGMGLGLAIARRLVEAHGGEISVESQAGQGATMRFWVPLTEVGG